MRSCVTSQLEMNMAFLPSVVHMSCIVANGDNTDDSRVANGDKTDDSNNTFCGNKCREV
jgi:hypothetical protein